MCLSWWMGGCNVADTAAAAAAAGSDANNRIYGLELATMLIRTNKQSFHVEK